jgi:hypothetical protein
MRRRNVIALMLLPALGSLILMLACSSLRIVAGFRAMVLGHASVEDRARQFGPATEGRLRARFETAGLPYPPTRLTIVVLKEERELRLCVPAEAGPRAATRFRILGASGGRR